MNYYIVIALSAPYGAATHVGLKQPPKLGGDWLFDLLQDVEGPVLQEDCTAPASPAVSSLSELTSAQAKADIEAHLGLAS